MNHFSLGRAAGARSTRRNTGNSYRLSLRLDESALMITLWLLHNLGTLPAIAQGGISVRKTLRTDGQDEVYQMWDPMRAKQFDWLRADRRSCFDVEFR
jgi:hypothetical protein